ncbi:MAG: hypothetical protein IKX13_07335 [Bacteroidales bacterium]|jgi:hypothetical protein|nr:hypothetical protein [Bacteroidales bacterium]MBR5665547.1 hypothetical protein [Bacteroidales bacterium]
MENHINIKELFKSGSVEGVRKSLFGYRYTADGSRITFYETCFEQKDLQKMKQFLENGNLAALNGIRKQQLGSHRMQCFIHAQNAIAWVQLGEFVPYRFQEITGMVTLEQEAAQALAEFLKR